ncbi:MAG: AmmeMemoRadiSam system protein A [Nitrospinota bacterium]
MHSYVELALRAIREQVKNKKRLQPPDPLPEEMKDRAGAFVCLKIKNRLRGCIGTIEPSQDNLADEIISNAISASTHDSRFDPLAPDEIDDIEVTVDVLSEPEPVGSLSDLDPKIYGLIVKSGLKRGLLLPDIEGVDDAEQQLSICRRKGGIGDDEEVSLQRFTVTRYR